MVEYLPNFPRDMNERILKAKIIPNRIRSNKLTSRNIIIKLWKIKNKGKKILKVMREEKQRETSLNNWSYQKEARRGSVFFKWWRRRTLNFKSYPGETVFRNQGKIKADLDEENWGKKTSGSEKGLKKVIWIDNR